MRKVFILYSNFFSEDGKEIKIGGVQTYIRHLCTVIRNRGDVPIVFQWANQNFIKQYNDFNVHGIDVSAVKKPQDKWKLILNSILEDADEEKDIIIFATDSINLTNNFKKSITIQHGVCWDVPSLGRMNKFVKHFDVLNRARVARKRIIQIENSKNIVCVDYNFLNWYRTQVAYIKGKYFVIPNCVKIEEDFKKRPNSKVKIIFARRFETIRGTELFAESISFILNTNKNVQVTLAGDGPRKQYLIDTLSKYENVDFITYSPEQSYEIHKKYDIAVVPTIGSEGTSLSLLEAMSAKCAVVASNVGGMTNIILSGFNGLLISPNKEELISALNTLIQSEELRLRLGNNAFITTKESFSFNVWEQKWNEVLDKVSKQ